MDTKGNLSRKLWAIILSPVFYTRYASLVFALGGFLIIVEPGNVWDRVAAIGVCWFCGGVFYAVMLGGGDLLYRLSEWAIRKFDIDYRVVGSWADDVLSMRSGWSFPIVEISGKQHKWTIVTSGGNMYDYMANLKRRVVFTYLWGKE